MPLKQKLRNFLATLGPGLLFASTAIGVSHLVQSTRAGANYGFALLWAIAAANLFKWPFFEFGSRYANVTGTSIIDGYRKIGRWALFAYLALTVVSMFFVSAAVGAVTASFLDNLFGLSALTGQPLFPHILLFVVCVLILGLGQYKALDSLIKVIGSVLLISTLVAFVITLINGPVKPVAGFEAPKVWDKAGIAFLIALMGWMPTAVDLSAWNSLWTVERIKQSGYKPSLKETLSEFNLAYWISAGLSICFLTLGAFLLFGSGKTMPEGGAAFASEVINLYTSTMGDWSYFIIATAAFSIMFGTSIGVFDGYARAFERSLELLWIDRGQKPEEINSRRFYQVSLLLTAFGSFGLIFFFMGDPKGFKKLVDVATTVSFLIAPFVALVNFYLVTQKSFPKEGRPGIFMRIISILGLIFLIGFCILFLAAR